MTEERPWRFLIADDDSCMLDAITVTLRNRWPDATVARAADGFEVTQAVESADTPFDVLILDIVMPGMGGLETLTALKEQALDIPTLAISGGLGASFDKKPILEMASFLGAASVLEKPFTGKELIPAVEALLRA